MKLPLPYVALVAVLVSANLAHAKDPVYTSFFSNVAIKGYDTVAYHTDGAAMKGSTAFTYQWRGAVWRFASAGNRDRFAANPQQYAPQYGGYCAWAVSQGTTAGVDPRVWKIVDGKLYLNYDDAVQVKWETDVPGNIEKADKNWPAVLN
jgi:YHS domain-containing protein